MSHVDPKEKVATAANTPRPPSPRIVRLAGRRDTIQGTKFWKDDELS